MRVAAFSVTGMQGRGYMAALGSAAVLAFSSILIRYISDSFALPVLALAFWRNAFVCAVLLPLLLVLRTPLLGGLRAHWRFFLCYGSMLAVFNVAWTLSVVHNGASVATVMNYCSIAYIAVFARLLLGERCTMLKSAASLLCFCGCVLVAGMTDMEAWRLNGVGVLAGVLSGLLYAAYSLMGRSAAQRGVNPWATLLYTFGCAACVLWALNAGFAHFAPEAGLASADLMPQRLWGGGGAETALPLGWLALLTLAVGPTLLGYGLYNVSLCHLPSSVANLVLTLEPVLTALVAYRFLGERLSAVQWAGGVCIMGGVLVLRLAVRSGTPGEAVEAAEAGQVGQAGQADQADQADTAIPRAVRQRVRGESG